ncbi:MAG: hypothetical protein WEB87_01445 [Bacteriovoracaceae bacterium]
MQEFIEKIIKNLESNGFPDKRVSLPVEKMYEAADKRDLSFNKVLDQLKTNHCIDSEVGIEKIVFSKSSKTDNLSGAGQEDMMKKAQEMMAQMDPAELEKMQESVMNMSEEEKEEMLKKAKEMGLL